MRRLIRVLAVIALVLSPVWGYQSVDAASSPAPSRLPQWPSYASLGCSLDPSGIFTCGSGGTIYTQIPQLYQCAIPQITVNTVTGTFTITIQDPAGSARTTVTEAGTYRFVMPFFTLIGQVEYDVNTAAGGTISVSNLVVTPCDIPNTNTPVPATSTPNPSFTPTSTVTAGPSPTFTAIPSYTPIVVTHNTFTPTITRTPVPGSSTPTPSVTPFPTRYDCGDPTFPLLNCGMGDNISFGGTFGYKWYGVPHCFNPGGATPSTEFEIFSQTLVYGTAKCEQDVVAHATGNVYMQVDYSMPGGQGGNSIYFDITGSSEIVNPFSGQTSGGLGQQATINMGPVTAGNTYTWYMRTASSDGWNALVHITNIWVGSTGGTPLPTASPTPTATVAPATQTAIAIATLTAVAADYTPTPLPIPGAMSTNIPTSTECPGSCTVASLTQVPGMATITTVDTSPFSPLKNLSLSRTSCQPFGYVPVPMPVIIGTPAIGSTTPLSYTWTVPITGVWDDGSINGVIPLTNTAIQPCAMKKEIPSFVWDLTYWLSVIMLAVGWFLWLIGFVGRLSGEETING